MGVLAEGHSVLWAGVGVLTGALGGTERRFAVRHAAIYLSTCAPAAIFVTLLRKWLIGEAYEPDYSVVATQLEGVFGHAMSDFSWSLSAVTQAGLFFKYLALWLWPDTRAMSIGVRVGFFETWSAGWGGFKVSAFFLFCVLGL